MNLRIICFVLFSAFALAATPQRRFLLATLTPHS